MSLSSIHQVFNDFKQMFYSSYLHYHGHQLRNSELLAYKFY